MVDWSSLKNEDLPKRLMQIRHKVWGMFVKTAELHHPKWSQQYQKVLLWIEITSPILLGLQSPVKKGFYHFVSQHQLLHWDRKQRSIRFKFLNLTIWVWMLNIFDLFFEIFLTITRQRQNDNNINLWEHTTNNIFYRHVLTIWRNFTVCISICQRWRVPNRRKLPVFPHLKIAVYISGLTQLFRSLKPSSLGLKTHAFMPYKKCVEVNKLSRNESI